MTVWLNVVGVTERGLKALSPEASALISAAQTVLGPKRLVDQLPTVPDQKQLVWQSPLSAMIEQIKSSAPTPTVVLATGDPNWFGIGATIAQHISADEFELHPALSSFQLAASRMNWPLQNTQTISLHGRPVSTLQPVVQPGARLLALTSDRQTLPQVAHILQARGYGQSQLTVLENLGGVEENISTFTANISTTASVGDFYVLAIDCVADVDAPLLPTIPGLPDESYAHDGQLTKREVRAVTLAKLGPTPGAHLWDVGAGSGAIGIEWMRSAPGATAMCFERDPQRCARIRTNAEALGTPGLKIIEGEALAKLSEALAPDAVFLGGAVADDDLFQQCWQALTAGGRLVANAVTLDSRAALMQRHQAYGGDLSEIAVSHLSQIGSQRMMRPRAPVLQWSVTKGVK